MLGGGRGLGGLGMKVSRITGRYGAAYSHRGYMVISQPSRIVYESFFSVWMYVFSICFIQHEM